MEAIIVVLPLYLAIVRFASRDVVEELAADSTPRNELSVVFVHGGLVAISFITLFIGFVYAAGMALGRTDDPLPVVALLGPSCFSRGFRGLSGFANTIDREGGRKLLGTFILGILGGMVLLYLILTPF